MISEKNKELHILLEKEILDKLEAIKHHHGIKKNTEIIRFMITKEYRKLNKSE